MLWYFYGKGVFSFLGAFIAYNDFVEFALIPLAAKFVDGGEALICDGFAASVFIEDGHRREPEWFPSVHNFLSG